jgi:hypothetical protein
MLVERGRERERESHERLIGTNHAVQEGAKETERECTRIKCRARDTIEFGARSTATASGGLTVSAKLSVNVSTTSGRTLRFRFEPFDCADEFERGNCFRVHATLEILRY